MTPPVSKEQSEMTTLKVDVGVMKSQMEDLKLVTDRIEKKIDGMTYATTTDLAGVIKMIDEYKKEVRETYVSKESFDPIKQGFYKFVGIVVTAVLLAVLGLVLVKK